MSVHVQWSRVRAAVAVAVVLMLVVVCAPLPLPLPLSHTHPHHTMSSPSATSHHVFLLFLRSLTMPAVSLVNSLANLSYYFLFCPVATSPCLPLSAQTGRLQRMRCVRLLLPEKYLNNSNRKFPRCRLVVYLIKNENNVHCPRSK